MIVFDASVLIAFLDREDALHGRADELLAREIENDFAASSLTLAEVLVGPERQGRLDEVRAALDNIGVHDIALPGDLAVRLARLRAATGLKMPDCCVLLAAEDTAARIASFDRRLLAAAAARRIPTVQG